LSSSGLSPCTPGSPRPALGGDGLLHHADHLGQHRQGVLARIDLEGVEILGMGGAGDERRGDQGNAEHGGPFFGID
jgi:hypothetical protein